MMDHTEIRAAIEQGTAGDAVPGMTLTWLRDIVSGRRDLAAVRHPLGFLCFPAQRLAEHGVCVHLWTSGTEHVLTTSQVHAHSWDLTSYVLYGTLRNQRIRVLDAPESATHRVFEVRSRGDVDELHATGRLVTCQPETDSEYATGSVYALAAGEFHATVPGGQDVATVVLSRSRAGAADRALGPVDAGSHTLTRSRCDTAQTTRAARLIADRLAAA
jgi:hypothetical protein